MSTHFLQFLFQCVLIKNHQFFVKNLYATFKLYMKKLTLVTGGKRGIGRAITLALQKAEHEVVGGFLYHDENVDEMREKHNILFYQWDVSDFESCQNTVEQICKEQGGYIATLINNAGITSDAMLHKMTHEQWLKVINVNLGSCFNMSRAVIEQMREQKYGKIVNISSVNALQGCMGQTNYAATKAGIIGFTKSLALETAKKGITVNAVAPGYTDTEMMGTIPEEVMAKIIAQIPMGRLGATHEIADMVAFLCSEKANFITGQVFSVNGGQY